jgi:dipeptidyl-peptidase-4
MRVGLKWRLVAATVFAGGCATAVCEAQETATRKELTVERIYSQPSLSGRPVRGLAWAPDGKTVSFFETAGSGKEAKTELWAMDAATGERRVLVSAETLESVLPTEKGRASQATGAARRPPAEYQWAADGSGLLFAGAKALAWLDLKTQAVRVLVSGKESISDAKISPDRRYASFVREHNLWLVGVAGGKERALTKGGTEEIRKGELDWVYPEELEIKTAYWWAPDSSAIAFLEMDERKVTQYPLVDFESYSGEAEMERYPVAGGANPVVHVYVAPVAGGAARLMDTGAEADQYVARVNWLTDSKHVAIQRLNRAQTQLDLVVADAATGKSRVLLSEKDGYWINLSDDLRFLQDGKRFLWTSERAGYRHAYVYDFEGKEIAQLTKGEWEITSLDGVDEAKGLVYFTATEKSALERHLYKVGLDGSGFARLTQAEGTHAANFSSSGGYFVDIFSDSMTPPRADLCRADGSHVTAINENRVAELAEYHLMRPETFTVTSHDGMALNAMMIKPPGFDPKKRYPVLIYVYGGPHVQVVRNAWSGPNYLWHQLMAEKGYIIFSLDNRGSAGRGHLFEEPIHFRLGAQELADQRDGVAWLKAQPFVDASRIGIWGGSYGGHMTLHAMFEASQDFKAGFAAAPVTDWRYYDSIYTERYLGLLPQNLQSYKESSPIENVAKLKGKLLIAHGTGDDNVHFSNTLALVDDLIEAGKAVEVMPFPGRGHGISDPAARKLMMKRVMQFFLDNL